MEPAKFCTQCGKPLPPNARHCPNCGAEVTAPPAVPPGATAETAVSPPPQPAPVAGPNGAPPTSGQIPPAPVRGVYNNPSAPSAGNHPAAGQAVPPPPVRPRKRLGGGGITLLAGLIMLAMHVLVLEGGKTVQNLGVDAAIIACGLIMVFARGGLNVALGFLASLCVSILDAVLLLAVFKSVAASGMQGLQTLVLSMAWVSVIAMILVLLGFLSALVSLFRRR